MKNYQNKKTLQVVLLVLIAVLTLGVGYASINAIDLIIDGSATANPNDTNFKVKFLNEDGVTPTIENQGASANSVRVDSDTTASFNVVTLNGAGQSVTATYRVKNESSGIGASIGLELTNSNPDYFQVTQKILDNKLQAGEETTVTVKVEMIKIPVDSAVSTSITATLIATPIENAEASGGDEKKVVKPVSYVYTINGVDLIYLNTDISTWTRVYSNFPAAKAEFGHPAAIANVVDNGKVTESYVAFERNNKVHYLKGRISETDAVEKPVYEHNVLVLKEAFPDWETTCTVNTNGFYCSADTFNAYAYIDGSIYAGVPNSWDCALGGGGGAATCGSW